jgi:hypothetical protein
MDEWFDPATGLETPVTNNASAMAGASLLVSQVCL